MNRNSSLQASSRTRSRRHMMRGEAVLEIAFLVPWIFFLFAGAFDTGFYSYALIATQEAARAGAEYTSRNSSTVSDSAAACQFAIVEMRALSNVAQLTSCGASPLLVTAQAVTDADGYADSAVTVTYTTGTFIP